MILTHREKQKSLATIRSSYVELMREGKSGEEVV
jgi:hypothetical protein